MSTRRIPRLVHDDRRRNAPSRVIDGLLDLLPPVEWDERGLSEWLAMFESGLRVIYRLPVEDQ